MDKIRPKPSEIAREWADADPLSRFLSDRSRLGTASPDGQGVQSGREDGPSSLETAARMLRSASYQIESSRKATLETENDLVAGRLTGIGRKPNSHQFERIPASYWIGAAIEWGRDAVTRDGEELIEVRITSARTIDTRVETLEQPRPGRPTKGDVILAAISDYAADDPTLKGPRSERFRAYRAYISEQGYDPRKDDGFSDKTIEKFETEYRKEKR